MPDTVAAVTAVTDNAAPRTGNVADGAATNDNTPTISGSLSAPLVPGESVVLSLRRTVRCDGDAMHGPSPEHLVLTARGSADDDVVVRLPVADEAAYGGRLDEALRDPGRACVATGDVGGPLGDLVGSWRARRAWPPVPSR